MRTFGSLRYVAVDDAQREYGHRDVWALSATPDVMLRVKRILPRSNTYRRSLLTFEHTREVAADLEWLMQRWPLEMSADDRARLAAAADAHRERQDLVNTLLAGARWEVAGRLEPIRVARPYQETAANLAMATGRLLLADELGLGKTMTCLLALAEPGFLPAVVVCPVHLQLQWRDEIAATFPVLKTHIVRRGQPYDPARTRELRGHDPDVLIISYHKLRGWAEHLRLRVKGCIFDEAHELRRAGTDKYKAAGKVADAAQLVMGATATPVYNYAGEIHNVMSVLAPDALGSREEFAREWGGSYWSDKLKVHDPPALGTYLRDQGLMLRRTRAEVGRELPFAPVRVTHAVDADQRAYEAQMEAEGAADLAELILHSENRQEVFTASGDLDWKVRQATGVAKAPFVSEFVKLLLESERKVVLYGWHRAVYRRWLRDLEEFGPRLYTGSESPGQKQAAKQDFLSTLDADGVESDEPTPGECRVLIMSLRSGAGLDGLQQATRTAVFGELDWSPAMHDQCVGRLARDGQLNEVLAYFLVSEVGADPVIADVLELKRQQSEPIRDPDAKLFEVAPDTRDRVRRLAEAVVAKRRRVGAR